MSLAEAFVPALAWQKEVVMRDTWGHLDPPPGRYPGWILFAHGVHGDLVVLDSDFTDTGGGPWFFEELQTFTADESEQTGLYVFVGIYQRFKNGRGRFRGMISRQDFETLRQHVTARPQQR